MRRRCSVIFVFSSVLILLRTFVTGQSTDGSTLRYTPPVPTTTRNSAQGSSNGSTSTLPPSHRSTSVINETELIPVFRSMTPTEGPAYGGTNLTFNVSIHPDMYPLEIRLEGTPVNASVRYNRSQEILTAVMPPVADAFIRQPFPVVLVFNNSLNYSTGFNYTYLANPVIQSFTPHQYIYTGGIQMTVFGTALNVAITRVLEVTTVSQLWSQGQIQTTYAFYKTSCVTSNSTMMTCVLPPVDVAKPLVDYLNSNRSSSRQINATFVDDGLNNTIKVYVGFLFDNYVYYRNVNQRIGVDQGYVVLVAPPRIASSSQTRLYYTNSFEGLEITGENLNRGCELSDYRVDLESIQLPVIYLGSNSARVSVDPEVVSNVTRATFTWNCVNSTSYRLQVHVANRDYRAYCVDIHSPCRSHPCQNDAKCHDSNITEYSCQCSENFYGNVCQNAYPIITGISPAYGPLAGGTLVTIFASLPPPFDATEVYFGDELLDIFRRSSDLLVVKSAPVDEPAENLTVIVSYRWPKGFLNRSSPDVTFSYRSHPNISSISPQYHLYTGHTTLTVNGANLNSAASPVMNINMVIQQGSDDGWLTSLVTSVCTPSDVSMVCRMPSFHIPSEVLPLLDVINYVPSPSFGVVPSLSSRHNQSLADCLSDDVTPLVKDYTITFSVGFIFDDFREYAHYGYLTMYAPPKICFNMTFLSWKVFGNQLPLTIWGRYLLRGCSASDYSVYIEDVECDLVGLQNDSLSFVPPANVTPTADHFRQWDCPPDYEYHLVVYVAEIVYNVGCVHYETIVPNYCESNPCANDTECTSSVDGYVCVCMGILTDDGQCDRDMVPLFFNMTPTNGPSYGGTVVTFNAFIPRRIHPTAIKLQMTPDDTYYSDNIQYDRLQSTGVFSAVIPTVPNTIIPVSVPVFVVFNQSSVATGLSFTFLPNPNITSLKPHEYVYTGGTRLTVSGTNLDLAQTVGMDVTTVNHLLSNGQFQTSTFNYHSNCSATNSTQLICTLPTVILPEVIRVYLDGLDQGGTDYTQLLNRTYVGDGSNTMKVYIGILFDHYDYYKNVSLRLSSEILVIVPPPTILSNIESKLYYKNSLDVFNISGKYLDRGCDISDYHAYLEETEFPVTNLASSAVWVTIGPVSNTNLTIASSGFSWRCSDSTMYRFQIQIGYHSYSVYCVSIYSACDLGPCKNNATCAESSSSLTGYSCICTENFYGDTCENGYPVVGGIFPTYGPLAGKTSITINATAPPQFIAERVYLGNVSHDIDIVKSMPNYLVIESQPFVGPPTVVPVIVVYKWQMGHLNRTAPGLVFNYLANPTVSAIQPHYHIYTGGTVLTVSGTYLSSVVTPLLNVTMTIRSSSSILLTATYISACQANTSQMACRMPFLDVPMSVMSLLDVKDYFPSSPFGVINATGSNRSLAVCSTSYPASNQAVTFDVGFLFDGYKAYLKYDQLTMYTPPELCRNTTFLTWQMYKKPEPLIISGQYLLRGCSISDYSVYIENTSCPVTGLNNDSLACLPPAHVPTARVLPRKNCSLKFEYHLLVYIADRLYEVGCVHYDMQPVTVCDSNPCTNGTHCVTATYDSYTCECYGTFQADGWCNRDSKPHFTHVKPNKGTLKGGTLLTFTAFIPLGVEPTEIWLYLNQSAYLSVPVRFSSESNGTFTAKTPKASSEFDNVPLNISVVFDNSQTYQTGLQFTYSSDPIIERVSPLYYVYTGGTQMIVEGTGLDVAATPVVEVTTVTSLWSNGRYQSSTFVYRSNCKFEEESTMLNCILPSVVIPKAISDYFDKLDSDYTNETTSELPYANMSYIDDGLNNTMRVYVGVLFDNFVYYRNLSQVPPSLSFVLVPPPQITFNKTPASYALSYGGGFTIPVKHGDLGCVREDYKAYLEEVEYGIDNITHNLLFINYAENTIPNRTAHFKWNCSDSEDFRFQIVVANREYPTQCLDIYSPCKATPCKNGGTCYDSLSKNWNSTNTSWPYICDCTTDFNGNNCETALPVISAISPFQGPVAGGTTITISTTLESSVLGVYLGNLFHDNIAKRGPGYIVFESLPQTDPALNLSVVVVYDWVDKLINRSAPYYINFSYLPNPNISSVSPLYHLYTGGTMLYVHGTSLSTVISPLLNVTMTVKRSEIEWFTAKFISACQPNETMLTCRMPMLYVPSEIIPLLDAQSCVPFPTFGSVNLSVNPDDMQVVECTPSVIPYVSTSGLSVTFTIGFEFDGYQAYNNYGPITIYSPPEICENKTFLVWEVHHTEAILTIQGRHLLCGCTEKDYSIFIEDVECELLGLDDNHLTFRPSTNATPTSDYFSQWICPPEYEYHLVVHIGNQFYKAGCVDYNMIAPDYCLTKHCQNGGKCTSYDTHAECTCDLTFYYGDLCELASPVLYTVSPNYGPLAGGSAITLTGWNRPGIFLQNIYIGNISVGFQPTPSNNNWTVTTKTPQLQSVGAATITLVFNDTDYPWNFQQTFNYRPNPTVSKINPRDHNRKGGTRLTLTGTNLDVSLQPLLAVNTTINLVNTVEPDDQTFQAFSHKFDKAMWTSNQLVFHLPPIQISDEFENILDRYVTDLNTQEGDYSTIEMSADNATLISPDTNNTMNVTLTLVFDAFKLNLPQTLLVHNPPIVIPYGDPIIFYPNSHNQTVELPGNNLTVGCGFDDYKVFVDTSECHFVDLEYDRLQFIPPENVTNTTGSNAKYLRVCNRTNEYHLVVQIGGLRYDGGCIEYYTKDDIAEREVVLSKLLSYVGAAVGGAFLVVIVIACFTGRTS